MTSLKDIEDALLNYQPAAGRNGDGALNPGMAMKPPTRDAAVLILLIERPEGVTILFTERTHTLNAHAGQVSFPGGGVEAHDKDANETALREAAEEIGLDVNNARVIGQLDEYVTRTGFRVTPIVAVLKAEQSWVPSPDEVARIFEVPVDDIFRELKEESLTFEGGERRFYGMKWDDMHIWGATAGMLRNFADVVNHPPAANDAANDTIGPKAERRTGTNNKPPAGQKN
ncbi:MAG TPA: CoA pyrophosphatase [Patescibacteria group bacterium]|nr:CoA pyrophosphatase [Patescibacteria group bacterium]